MSLQLCAMTNDLEGLKKCLKGGQGINDKDENGNAALHQCSMYGAIDVLEYLISNGADVNVLDDPNIRIKLSEYSNWPTIPQLFVNGELVGGCDITVELFQNGELKKILRLED